jgi:hypothetical protein
MTSNRETENVALHDDYYHPKPQWLDSIENGNLHCKKCSYKTDCAEFLHEHLDTYHQRPKPAMILYLECDGSIDGRNALVDSVTATGGGDAIDCTGGQAAFEDGDLQQFGKQLVKASRNTGVRLCRVLRMFDPGVGLNFAPWWIEGGLQAGVFQAFRLPKDVQGAAGGSGVEWW